MTTTSNKCGEREERHIFTAVIKAQWCIVINTYGIKPVTMTGWALIFLRGRRDFTLKASFFFDGTN